MHNYLPIAHICPRSHIEDRTYIERVILECAYSIIKHGAYSSHHDWMTEELLDVLHEHIEENLEKFLPEEIDDEKSYLC